MAKALGLLALLLAVLLAPSVVAQAEVNTTEDVANDAQVATAAKFNLTSASRTAWPGCPANGFLQNVLLPAAGSPWSVVYDQPYRTSMQTTQWDLCKTRGFTYMAAVAYRIYGADKVVEIGAVGETLVMTQQRCNTQLHNGFFVYRCSGRSFGFAGNSNIQLRSADVSTNNETYRLSWHDHYRVGGWRAGAAKSLNGNSQWKKAIICSNTCAAAWSSPPPPPSPPPPSIRDAINNSTGAVGDAIDSVTDAGNTVSDAAGTVQAGTPAEVDNLKDSVPGSLTVTVGSAPPRARLALPFALACAAAYIALGA